METETPAPPSAIPGGGPKEHTPHDKTAPIATHGLGMGKRRAVKNTAIKQKEKKEKGNTKKPNKKKSQLMRCSAPARDWACELTFRVWRVRKQPTSP